MKYKIYLILLFLVLLSFTNDKTKKVNSDIKLNYKFSKYYPNILKVVDNFFFVNNEKSILQFDKKGNLIKTYDIKIAVSDFIVIKQANNDFKFIMNKNYSKIYSFANNKTTLLTSGFYGDDCLCLYNNKIFNVSWISVDDTARYFDSYINILDIENKTKKSLILNRNVPTDRVMVNDSKLCYYDNNTSEIIKLSLDKQTNSVLKTEKIPLNKLGYFGYVISDKNKETVIVSFTDDMNFNIIHKVDDKGNTIYADTLKNYNIKSLRRDELWVKYDDHLHKNPTRNYLDIHNDTLFIMRNINTNQTLISRILP